LRFAGKTVTFSFWARAGANYSSASSALKVEIVTGTGTDQNVIHGSYTGSSTIVSATKTLSTTWQKFSVSAAVASTATEIAVQVWYTPVGTAGASDYFEITGVQLEEGPVATPFEFEDYGTTLRKCQRYYQKRTADLAWFVAGTEYNSTLALAVFIPVCQMRGNISDVYASGTLWDVTGVGIISPTSITINQSGKDSATLSINFASGAVTQRAGSLRGNATGAYLAVGAEL